MSIRRNLITGGAGFIGSRLARRLADRGEQVWIYDNLLAQVHGPDAGFPEIAGNVVFEKGDVRDSEQLRRFVDAARPDTVYHLAAETGTGQSLDELPRYCDVNVMGTAHLLEALRRTSEPVRRIVLASTRAVYGEGAYRTRSGSTVVPPPRDPARMKAGLFTPEIPGDDGLEPIATAETTPPAPCSIYASTKLMQEYLFQQAMVAAPWSLVLLRFQNVYGPGQSLRNPYTGVLSVFTKQLLDGKGLEIYEDGDITRDFIFVSDIVEALLRAGDSATALEGAINIGTGVGTTILDAARALADAAHRPDAPLRISGAFRAGDIRYAVADIGRAQTLLGWHPSISFAEGARRLVAWAREEAERDGTAA